MSSPSIGPVVFDLDPVLRSFLEEDLGAGDVTSNAVVPDACAAEARIVARRPGVVSGVDLVARLARLVDPGVTVIESLEEGQPVAAGAVVTVLAGEARALLATERTALNLLGRMSGIASLTARFVEQVKGHPAVIMETRKTAPGLRWFDKRAVRAGGGQNHRTGLHDQVLIKENHLATMVVGVGERRPVEEAVRRAREAVPSGMLVEIEVTDVEEVRRAADAGADIILLDNLEVADVARAVEAARAFPGALLEASGGIHLDTVLAYARTGVHRISVGALTHSVPALDLSLLLSVR